MSTIAHRPHRALHVSRRAIRDVEAGLLAVLGIVALSAALSLVTQSSATTYGATVLRARAAQVHPGMPQSAIRATIGEPSHVVLLQGRGSTTAVWLYDARSSDLQYRLTFHHQTLTSIVHSGG